MELLETSVKALEIVKLVTAEIPIPGLSTAVECALSIAKKAKEIKDTREDCRALAERAAALVIALYQQLKNGSSDMGAQVYITAFLQKRDRVLFALKRGQIADEIKTLTAKLEDSFRVFMIQAALAINQDMNTLTNGNLRMLQHIDDSARVGEVVLTDTREIRTGLSDLAHRVGGSAAFDGNFRLFARENLTLLEPIIDSYIPHHSTSTQYAGYEHALTQTIVQPRTGRVFRYRAVVQATGELSGTQVVVHAYPNHDDQGFVEAVKFAKQTYHPHMLAMLGYSRPGGPGEATYIVMEHYIPFLEYLGLLRGADILRAYLKMMAETYAIGIPTMQTSRMHITENLRAVACARMETVVQHWLSLILSPMGVYDDFVPGHSWLEHWEHITDYPRSQPL
ncbi:hypothetical protein VTO73DRAFT_1647 [Trametes versicolor]